MNAEHPPQPSPDTSTQPDSIKEFGQDSELDRKLQTEELDFLESSPDDREPPVSSRTRQTPIAHKPRRGPYISTDAQSHSPARLTAPTPSYAPASAVRRSHLPPDELDRAR